MTMVFVCAVATGTFVMAPAELGEPACVCVALHWGADLAQREGGGGNCLRLERQQRQHERQERIIQREWRTRGEADTYWLFPLSSLKDIDLLFHRKHWCYWNKNNIHTLNKLPCMHTDAIFTSGQPHENPVINHPSPPAVFTGNEVRAGRQTRCDAVTPGNSQPPVSGEPSGQTDCGGEFMI